jgi:hypothetical protein
VARIECSHEVVVSTDEFHDGAMPSKVCKYHLDLSTLRLARIHKEQLHGETERLAVCGDKGCKIALDKANGDEF